MINSLNNKRIKKINQMKHYILTITAKEPLVLRTQLGSEVRSDVVDYIQGSKLLGLLAKQCYARLKQSDPATVYQLFHSGNVRYGNAYPMYQNQVGFPVPFSMHKTKDDVGTSKFSFSVVKDGTKKKQQKEGYIIVSNGELSLFTVPVGERLKSARDLKNRRSKDESMYLYSYLKRGVVFQSTISVKEATTAITETIQQLEGQHYIGTSKGEFGRVAIEVSEVEKNNTTQIIQGKHLKIYAVSDLIFLNDVGNYTTKVQPEMFGIENAELDLEASYIRFQQFHTYNSKRRTPDADRISIKKGSVLVFKSTIENQEIAITSEIIKNGVGVHKTEGFGQVLVNPAFLEYDKIDGSKKEICVNLNTKTSDVSTDFGTLLSQRNETITQDHKAYDETLTFIKKHQKLFKSTTQSQWGSIRHYTLEAIASNTPKQTLREKLVDTEKGYLREKANANWKLAQVDEIKKLLEKANCLDLLLKISVELPKTLKND